MGFKGISRKQKLYLLAFGLLIICFLIVTGRLFIKKEKQKGATLVANEELLILGTKDSLNHLEENQVYTDKGLYYFEGNIDWAPYLYQSVQAVTEENQILHINNLLQREVKLKNCLIIENNTEQVTMFSEGFQIQLPCRNLTASFSDEIADIYLTNGNVTKISTTKENISGEFL